MGNLDREVFICLDLETTGLLPEQDRIIEVAACRFRLQNTLDTFETLVDPKIPINPSSIDIHHITDDMVAGKPTIEQVLGPLFQFIDRLVIVGHGIPLDLAFLKAAAVRAGIPYPLHSHLYIDTLRLARLYGESPVNSLEKLRQHFNIAAEGSHRAMNDVIVNVEVFKHLAKNYQTLEEMLFKLKHPIRLKTMPLGKHKGRAFSEIPLEYLQWASRKEFDQDLLFSIRLELKRRKKGNLFEQASNPFAELSSD